MITSKQFAERLNLSLKQLNWLAFSPDKKRYKTFEIPKKNGGLRRIDEPTPTLKWVQSKLVESFENSFSHSKSSHGFIRGKSIVTNANAHKRKPWVVNIDLENFFPSIKRTRVFGLLKHWEIREGTRSLLQPDLANIIAHICCFHDIKGAYSGLPQGAPTSPIISNMISKKLDFDLNGYAWARHLKYSRYADDISFSPANPKRKLTTSVLIDEENKLDPELNDIIKHHGFKINRDKVRVDFRPLRLTVTGLVVNDKVNIPRKQVRLLRSYLDLWEKHGLNELKKKLQKENVSDEYCLRFLTGKLSFLSMVRGKGDHIYLKFRRRLIKLFQANYKGPDKRGFDPKTTLRVDLGDCQKMTPRQKRINETAFNKYLEEGDFKELQQTFLGAWAFERIHYKLASEDYSDNSTEFDLSKLNDEVDFILSNFVEVDI